MTKDQVRSAMAALTVEERKEIAAEFCAPLKVQTGWRGILADTKLPLTLGIFIVSSVSTWQAMKGETPAIKLQYFETWMYSASGIWGALMVALGFQKGKLNEGTVAEGYVPVIASTKIQTPNGPAIVPVATVVVPPPSTILPPASAERMADAAERMADAAEGAADRSKA